MLLRPLFILICCITISVGCSDHSPTLKPLKKDAIILAFGDSLTYGIGTQLATNYPAILQNITQLTVVNAGVPGEETSGGLARIKHELAKTSPQLVIICLGGNDLLRKRSYVQIKENLKSIVKIIQQENIQVMLIAVPTPKLSMEVPSFYGELGTELNIPVETNTLASLLAKTQYKSDYIHLNTIGYELMAKSIYEFLVKSKALQ